MPRVAKRVWFVVVPGSEALDLAGPWQVLGHTNDVLGRQAYDLSLVGPRGPTVRSLHGLTLGGVGPLPERPRRLPTMVIVAGGSPRNPAPAAEKAAAAWLRRHHERIPTLVSICTGAFVLGEAGLLEGRRVTTHWRYLDALRSRFPSAQIDEDGIYVRDGALWTSAGVTAGIDLMLALVEEDHGHAVAMAVAKQLVLFLRRSGNQAQWSNVLRHQDQEPGAFQELIAFAREHLAEPLPVERLAKVAGMSPRSLSRWCRRAADESPADLVRRLRLEEARRLLECTSLPIKAVAVRTGLGDPTTLWRAFTRHFGVTPTEYRVRFAPPPEPRDPRTR